MAVPPSQKQSNRYELPPESRPDSREEAAEVEEQIDTREDLPDMQTEKGESSAIDSAYAGEVSNYFNERRLIAAQTGGEDTELFDHDKFLAMQQQSLEKLANPATGRELRPKDVALALGDLAGTMAGTDLEIAGNRTGDQRVDRDTESSHARAKKIFMDSCGKKFAGVAANKEDLGGDIRRTVELLGQDAGAELPPDLKEADLDRLVEDDPRQLTQALDQILYKTGDRLQAGSRIGFDLKDQQRREEASGHLVPGVENFYKLQLLRDALQEKVNRAAEQASTADKMEAARQAMSRVFGSEEAPEGAVKLRGEAEKAAAAGEKAEPGAGGKGAEPVPAGKEKIAAPPEAAGPAGEALKAVWKKEGMMGERLKLLTGRVDNMTELKLQADPNVGPEFARRLSLRQIFGELLPAETKALQEAARKESEERRREAEEKKRPDLIRPVSAEKLFIDLMNPKKE